MGVMPAPPTTGDSHTAAAWPPPRLPPIPDLPGPPPAARHIGTALIALGAPWTLVGGALVLSIMGVFHGAPFLAAGLGGVLGGRSLRRGRVLREGHFVLGLLGGFGTLIVFGWFGPWQSNVSYDTRTAEVGFYIAFGVVALWMVAISALLFLGNRLNSGVDAS